MSDAQIQSIGTEKSVNVQKQTTQFKDNIFYNFPFSNGQVLETYTLVSPDFNVNTALVDQENVGYVNYRFQQHPISINDNYTRLSFMEFLSLIGGFIGVVVRLTEYSITNYQKFTIDKSMMKKLYSVRKPVRNRSSSDPGANPYEQEMRDTIASRGVFRHEYLHTIWYKWKQYIASVLCCYCLCRKRVTTSRK